MIFSFQAASRELSAVSYELSGADEWDLLSKEKI